MKSTFGFTSTTSDQFVAGLDESEKPELRLNRTRKANFNFNTSRSWIAEPQITYQKELGNHRITILGGVTFQYQNNNGRGFQASGQSSDLLLRDMVAGTSLSPLGVDINEYKYTAIFGRLNYFFKDKYLLNLTFRRDGSSRFGSNSKFNSFQAIGAGWILSEEQFFKNSLPILSFAKLRGSYGTTGNDQIGNYRFMDLYGSYTPTLPYQGIGGLLPFELPNANLEWEETRKLQMGLDMGLWKDRLLITANYARNRSSNSLTNVRMPQVTGFTSSLQNLPALIQNTDWEFSLNSQNITGGNFKWTSSINLTIPRNKLLAFPDFDSSFLKNFLIIGQPLNTTKRAPFYGVDPQTGIYLVTNRNCDPTNSPGPDDLTVFINSTARWYGGFLNNIRYKGFTLDFLVQFTKRYANDMLQLANIPGFFSSSNSSSMNGNQPVSVMNRWKQPGDATNVQRFSANIPLNTGDLAYRNASFLRLKNVSLSYEIPAMMLRTIKFKQLRVYTNAQNLFTITPYRGLDPETLSIGYLPPLRMITLGLQTTF